MWGTGFAFSERRMRGPLPFFEIDGERIPALSVGNSQEEIDLNAGKEGESKNQLVRNRAFILYEERGVD